MPERRAPEPAGGPVHRILPLGIATFVSAVAGLALTAAFPSLSWWPMVFVAVPAALLTLIGRRVWGSLLVGFAFGLVFFLVNVSFTARYLGPVPWLALSILEAILTAAGSVLIALAYRWVPRLLPGLWSRLVLLPLLVAGLWTAREELLGGFPYGGFPWARLGVTQVNSPLAHLTSWVGMTGLGFLIVFVCAAAIEYVRVRAFRAPLSAAPTAVAAILLLVVPQFPTTPAGTMRVGAVQGNGPAGYFDQHAPGAVLNAQLKATAPLIGKRMDVLLWPEGAVDSDPTQDPGAAATLDYLAEQIGAPLLVAAITQHGSDYFNSSLLWETGAHNPVQTYDKRHPVPFGEYVPDRWLYHALAPALVDLIQRGYTPGTAQPYMNVHGVGVGLAICFDVIYDDVIWDGARDGAEVYMFQTNNADFRGTDENLQQLAFARMRALETGRSVVNISTVGTSQVIAPDGRELAGIRSGVAGHMLTDVPLRTGLTPAVIAGGWIAGVLGWGSVAALIGFGTDVLIRRRRGKDETPAPIGTGVEE